METLEVKNFLEIQNLKETLQKLTPQTSAVFGDMKPQEMVEHLILSIDSSYKTPYNPEKQPTEQQTQLKKIFLVNKFPKNIKSQLYKNGFPALIFDNLELAIENLAQSIEKFKTHFQQNPTMLYYNGNFGSIGFEELKTFHQSHIAHHFEQFNLI